MKLSIRNFKTIKALDNFEIRPFTVISGINSSGKSSFIQLILLIKQTIELDSAKTSLALNGDLYNIRLFEDIIFQKDLSNKLSISLSFSKKEFSKVTRPDKYSIFDAYSDYECVIFVKYDIESTEVYVSEFSVTFYLAEGEKDKQFIVFRNPKKGNFSIETNTGVFNSSLFFNRPEIVGIDFSSIFPISFDSSSTQRDLDDIETEGKIVAKNPVNLNSIRFLVNEFFTGISYIGPLRGEPKDEYGPRPGYKNVGPKGENVAQILTEHALDRVEFYRIDESKDDIKYEIAEGRLIDAVKYWTCDVFKLAHDIFAKKEDDQFKVVLVGEGGLEASIKHVGFGISQVLPIVVEGIRMQKGGTLILEQPEIHLHPKLQSTLFDFLYSLIQQGKFVLLETHSDHLIKRMRRRVAEDSTSQMSEQINLTFIEKTKFRTIKLDEFGTLEYFPADFVEESSSELKAILHAQMKKRKKTST